jgi:hypothetical protein
MASIPDGLNLQEAKTSSFRLAALVVKVGPVNPKGEYDYVIVTDASSSYLSVLARDPVLFEKNYYDEACPANRRNLRHPKKRHVTGHCNEQCAACKSHSV